MSHRNKGPLLREAITAAPIREIYRIFFEIAAEPAVAQILESHLIIPVPSTENNDVNQENISPGGKRKRDAKDAPQARGGKRTKAATIKPLKKMKDQYRGLRTRWAKCRRCDEKYEILENKHGACLYHPGHTEFDPVIADVYWSHGIRETISEEDQERWTCCEEIGSAGGCKTGRHKELNGEGPENESSEDDDEEESGEESGND